MGVKKCIACGEVKALTDFYPNGKFFHPSCKDCHKARMKKWYADNRERIIIRVEAFIRQPGKREAYNAARRAAYARSRVEALQAYGGCCECCGESIPEFLAVDHIEGGGTKHRKQIGIWLYRWLKDHGYPKGFRLLCHNCNMGRELNNGICPHEAVKVRTA